MNLINNICPYCLQWHNNDGTHKCSNMKRPLNLTISEEARRLLALHAERSGTSVSGLIERLIREEETRWNENLRNIAEMARMIGPKVN